MAMFAETQKLVTELSLKDNLSRGLKGAVGGVKAFDKATSNLQKNLGNLGRDLGRGLRTGIANITKLAAVGFAGLTGIIAKGVSELEAYQQATFATNQVLKTTHGISGQTAESIRKLSEAIEDATTIDDKLVQSAANVLLTFTKIQKDTFPKALQAAVDLSSALGTDLQGAVLQVGKALQDPVRGLTALRRAGVSFTQQQEDQIRALVKAGRVEQAQTLILRELNKEFGGLAKAKFGTGLTATFNRLRDSFEDATRTLAEGLEPGLTRVANLIRTKLTDAGTLSKIRSFGKSLGDLLTGENFAKAGRVLDEVVAGIKEVMPTLREGLAFTGQIISKAVSIFKSLPPDLQKVAIAALAVNKLTGGAVGSIVGDLLKIGLSSLKTITAGAVTVFGATVTVPGVGGLPTVVGTGAKAAEVGLAAKLIGLGKNLIKGGIVIGAGLIGLDQVIQEANNRNDRLTEALKVVQAERSKADTARRTELERLIGELSKKDPNELQFDATGIRSVGDRLKDLTAELRRLQDSGALNPQARSAELERLIAELSKRSPTERLDPNTADLRTVGDRLKEVSDELRRLREDNPRVPPPPSVVPPGFIAALKSGITTGLAPAQRALIEQFKAAAALNRAGIFLRIAAQKQIAAAALQRALAVNLFKQSRPLRKGRVSSEATQQFVAGKSKLSGAQIVKVVGAETLALAQGGKGNIERNIRILEGVKSRLLKLGDKGDAAKIQRDIEALNTTLKNKKLDVQTNVRTDNKITVNADFTVTVDGRRIQVVQHQHTDYSSASTAGRQNLVNF